MGDIGEPQRRIEVIPERPVHEPRTEPVRTVPVEPVKEPAKEPAHQGTA